eukprot:m.229260 g.229260  ORF g.229260 m.229260 type:complete len:55 (+) comp15986_c0_seq6:175-339(+)
MRCYYTLKSQIKCLKDITHQFARSLKMKFQVLGLNGKESEPFLGAGRGFVFMFQ